ncbi:DUF6173 family protein [Clostridium felsineum]|uniref:Uncharacterized protein n=1 Tax=Clostridium felsineum TaxID=36839 RepID=A0A1S8M2E9_9CLOT|nr:DUF6173 family protein [Clostridium felsineum]URZ06783.1 hypothetical protein CLROS_021160 [Clostridium felsineum]URZ11815.1 hypothetical protein CROST_025320 [Clostridium felsineum]
MDYNYSNINQSMERITKSIQENKQYDNGFANIFYEQLMTEIKNFDKKLDDSNSVGMKLVTFGDTIRFNILDVGYKNPYLIYFYGELEDGSPIQLIQNVNQISFVLIAMARKNPEVPKQAIGFKMDKI